MTTDEVTALIGKPHTVIAESRTLERWVWVNLEGFTFATKTVRIDFENGHAVQAPPIPESFKD